MQGKSPQVVGSKMTDAVTLKERTRKKVELYLLWEKEGRGKIANHDD
jgi:hypothetical protein